MKIIALPHGELISDPRLFDANGVLQPMLSAWWAMQSREDKMRFGHHYGLYSFPTIEIVELLRQVMPGDTIEIGAGNGGYCLALGITGTDSYQQADPRLKFLYDLLQQSTIDYGPHVKKMDAIEAVTMTGARSVLASWVTHKYDAKRHNLGGNVDGVDEHKLLAMIDDYFFIGNTDIHNKKPIFQDLATGKITTHEIADIYSVGLHSRASGGKDVLIHVKRK